MYTFLPLKMTKKAYEAHIRERMYQIGFGSYYEPSEEFTFLLDLLKQHPNKTSLPPIKAFHLMPNAFNPQYIHMEVETNETQFPVSWVKCIRQPKATDKYAPLKQAMRNAVAKDTIQFKQQANLQCCACNAKNLSRTDFHTDHKTMPFKHIADAFIALYVEPTEFDRCERTGTKIFKPEDAEYERLWYEFHKERATYQILCNKCNIKKGAKLESLPN